MSVEVIEPLVLLGEPDKDRSGIPGKEIRRREFITYVKVYNDKPNPVVPWISGVCIEIPTLEVVTDLRPLTRKVLWVRVPVEAMLVDRIRNTFHHIDVSVNEVSEWEDQAHCEALMAAAIRRCEKSFCTYWEREMPEKFSIDELQKRIA